MSLISLLVNDWLLTALLGVACGVGVAAEFVGGFTDGKGLVLALPLLLFAVFFFALSVGSKIFSYPQINPITYIFNSVRHRFHII